MALQDPVAVYTAGTNLEAVMVCHILQQAGIEALVMEESVGVWIGGTLPGIHNPQVLVGRDDVARATVLVQDYESRNRTPDPGAHPEGVQTSTSVDAVCEECGQMSTFPAGQRGTVQDCPKCGALMDVGLDEFGDGWSEAIREEPEPE
jgi:hypothetical protein